MTRSRAEWWRIGGLTLPVAVIAALAGATTVFACTNVMGALTITPTSGPAGTTITTTTSGLVANATYNLHFGKTSGDNCMSFKGVITLGTITANASGAWSNVTAVIPRTAAMGVHGLCGMETKPVRGSTGTEHDIFTVT